MGKTRRARRREIVTALTQMSLDGWEKAVVADYAPLEAELQRLTEDQRAARKALTFATRYGDK